MPGITLTASAVVTIAATIFIWPPTPPLPSPPLPSPPPTVTAATRDLEPQVAGWSRRVTVTGPRVARQDEVEFERLINQLVELVRDLERAIKGDDAERAGQIQREADRVWAMFRRCDPPAEETALLMLGDAAVTSTPAAQLRSRLCLRVIGEGLTWRLRSFEASDDRRPLDQLVAGILTLLAAGHPAPDQLAALLIDKPYLSLSHEDQMLDLVAAAATSEQLVTATSRLLKTLWHNLERSGARSSAELAGLALLFLEDGNPCRRLAAMTYLLSARDGQFRDVVVTSIVRHHDTRMASAVSIAAAAELAPRAALAVLQRLRPLAKQTMMAAFMTLGERDADVLQTAYHQELRAGSDPELRAELVSGIGFRGPEGLALARRAFDLDPSVEVRSRAMFAMTSQAPAALGERTLMAALDDERFSQDPKRLGQVALALDNLANAGEHGAVDRVGRRLLAHPALTARDRERVDAMLARNATPRDSSTADQ